RPTSLHSRKPSGWGRPSRQARCSTAGSATATSRPKGASSGRLWSGADSSSESTAARRLWSWSSGVPIPIPTSSSGNPSPAALSPDRLDQAALGPAPIELAVEDLLPRAEIELALGDRHHHFAAHDLSLVVGVGVILARPIVLVARR